MFYWKTAEFFILIYFMNAVQRIVACSQVTISHSNNQSGQTSGIYE